MKVEPCKHETVHKDDLCDTREKSDLKYLSTQNSQEVTDSRMFNMVYNNVGTECSQEEVHQQYETDEAILLKNRKLILLCDLDQTLVHTTCDNAYKDLKEVHHFLLNGAGVPWYHTRIRPNAHQFLENISQFYELHVVTFGARPYAHKIVSLLDPDGCLFSQRIISRDEFQDASKKTRFTKTGKLKFLFPHGDNMVCIIDDREDVWDFSSNVIRVKPYVYFNNTGDINCPPADFSSKPKEIDLTEETEDVSIVDAVENDEIEIIEEIIKTDRKESVANASDNFSSYSVTSSPSEMIKDISIDDDPSKSDCDDIEIIEEFIKTDYREKMQNFDDTDDYLLHLEKKLLRVYRAYYEMRDKLISLNKSVQNLHLKNVIPYVGKKVLQGAKLVVVGLKKLDKDYMEKLATSLGAKVFRDFTAGEVPPEVTHIVSSRPEIDDIIDIKHVSNVHVVTIIWLKHCYARFEHLDERNFPLKRSDKIVRSTQKRKYDS